MKLKPIIYLVTFSSLLLLISCGGDNSENTPQGCEWNGNCSSRAPEGAYDCDGNSIVQCVKGEWEFVVACGSTTDGDGRACTCKGGCGTNTVRCSFAFEVCNGQSYETCGPNATAEINDSWECVPN